MMDAANSHPAPGMTPQAALVEPARHGRKAVRINAYLILIGFTLAYLAQLLLEAATRLPA